MDNKYNKIYDEIIVFTLTEINKFSTMLLANTSYGNDPSKTELNY